MKKFLSLLFCVLSCSLFLFGCDKDDYVKNLVTYAYPDSIVEYFYDLDNAQKTLNQDINALVFEQNATSDTKTFLSVANGRNLYFDVVRDCVNIVDTFTNREKYNLYDYSDLQDYQVQEVTTSSTTSGTKYSVSYNQKLSRNIVHNCDQEVDALIYDVPLTTTLTASVTKPSDDIFNLNSVIRGFKFVDDIQPYLENRTDADGNNVQLKLEVSQLAAGSGSKTYQKTILVATKVVSDPQGNVLSNYEHTSTNTLEGNQQYLVDTIKQDGQTLGELKLRMTDNSYPNVAISFIPKTGYFSYELKYNLVGQISVFGECYYQGPNKYLLKEYADVKQGTPFGISQSFLVETIFDNQQVKTKTKYNPDSVYLNIRNQDINNFASYTNEISCVCTTINSTTRTIRFY